MADGDLFPLFERRKLAVFGRSGVYKLFRGGACVYVGQTKDIVRRLREHNSVGLFFEQVSFDVVRCNTGLRVREAMEIKRMNPRLNVNRPMLRGYRKPIDRSVDQRFVWGTYCFWGDWSAYVTKSPLTDAPENA